MAAAFTASLTLPQPEDTMDVSSPGSRTHEPGEDIDIDIDFADYAAAGHHTEDEHMIEDIDNRPPTATDATMDDDMPQIAEEEMHDGTDVEPDHPQGDDDELIDYGEDEDYTAIENVQDSAVGGVTHDDRDDVYHSELALQEMPSETLHEYPDEEAVVEAHHATEHVVADQTETWTEETLAGYAGDVHDETGGDETATGTQGTDIKTTEFTGPQDDAEQDGSEPATYENEKTAEDEYKEPKEPQLPDPITTTAQAGGDTPPSPTDTGLHPMSLRYNGQEIPLFKSQHQVDGLLTDDNLVSVSLAELMEKCKEGLTARGEEFSHVQELVLGFNRLPLMLYESSRAAFSTSLNDVLETFLLLSQNDGPETPPVFSLNLTTHLAFDSSLAFLKQAAESGQGLTHVGRPQGDDGEGYEDVHYEEEYDDEAAENPEYDHYEEQQGNYEGTTDKHVAQENTVEYVENGDSYDGEAEYYEEEYAQEHVEHESGAAHDAAQQDEFHSEHRTDDGAGAGEDDLHEANGNEDGSGAQTEEQPELISANDAANDASAVSSVTIHGEEPTGPAAGDQEKSFTFVEDGEAENAEGDQDLSAWPDDSAGQHVDGNTAANEETSTDAGELYGNTENSAYNVKDDGAAYEEDDGNDLIDYGEADDQYSYTENVNADHTAGEVAILADEDHIDFDDDTTAEYEAKKASPAGTGPVTNSPAGKRSFQDLDDEDDIDFNEPEQKKPRS
ncbi:Hypothetical protein R9X50_00636700 [Acrodontium crateriforme]|uniref:Uncharacterized protein n=1 Tax=Acrodontium crateriforme TaxID=150365 RepID=A0AAQ3M9I1_9PEZI|nr:Hypothetical protein R9X50_00636700 [Acrodontium crateriforme]